MVEDRSQAAVAFLVAVVICFQPGDVGADFVGQFRDRQCKRESGRRQFNRQGYVVDQRADALYHPGRVAGAGRSSPRTRSAAVVQKSVMAGGVAPSSRELATR
ncbi:MAG: hypothetical protein IPK19_36065 [Chloroflexi bacterium]|nr:hypothetical protein [Chloroflexota bacterium]